MAWGADVNAKDSSGFTPLHLAVKDVEKHNNYSTIKKLLFKGANINAKDNIGRKPIDFTENFTDLIAINKIKNILKD